MITDYFALVSSSTLQDIRTKLGLEDNARAEPIAYPFKTLPSIKEVWFKVPGTEYSGSVTKSKRNGVIGDLLRGGTQDVTYTHPE